jgi:hypothetical protein
MSITAKLYGKLFLAMFNKEIDLLDDTIKGMFTTSGYTPDQDAHDYKDDITNEITGTGYTAGGPTLTGKTLTYTGATNKIMFDADDTNLTGTTITVRTVVLYDATPGSDATRPLLGYQQSSADISTTGGDFTIVWNASGIIEITVS